MSRDGRAPVIGLALVSLVLVAASSLGGILLDDGGDPFRVTFCWGQDVEVYGGHGLYRLDSMAKAVAFRGFDWAGLLICLPLSVLGMLLFSRGWLRGRLILAAVFTYLAYNYLVSVLGNAYNGLLLLWAALFATGVSGVAVTLRRLDTTAVLERLAAGFPTRRLAAYMLAVAAALLARCLAQLVSANDAGRVPVALESSATLELAALQLGLVVPLHVLGGVWLWRRQARGYAMALTLGLAGAMTFLSLVLGQVLLHVSFGADDVGGLVLASAAALVAATLSFVALTRVKA